jgi:hypothetical protein
MKKTKVEKDTLRSAYQLSDFPWGPRTLEIWFEYCAPSPNIAKI